MSLKERVMEVLKEHEGIPVKSKEIKEYFPNEIQNSISTTLSHIKRDGYLTLTKNGWIFNSTPKVVKVPNVGNVPITSKEVEDAKNNTWVGMQMLAVNDRKLFADSPDEPDTVVVTVTSKHPHLCMTDRGVSFTWAEVAKYMRDRRVPIG